ncbi:hypothetical protein GCM10027262_65920 [Nocardia tengchongensis]
MTGEELTDEADPHPVTATMTAATRPIPPKSLDVKHIRPNLTDLGWPWRRGVRIDPTTAFGISALASANVIRRTRH